MVKMVRLALAVSILTAALAALTPSFQDVSAEKGLLSFDQIDKQRLERNKYWGSTVADLDRDGNYDLFLCNHGNNPELYFGQFDRSFSYRDPKLTSQDLHATAAADLNNDGYLDFLINVGGSRGLNVNGHPIVHVVQGDQSFYRRVEGDKYRDLIGLGDVAHRGRAMMFLDMNADGYLDLLLLNQANFSSFDRHIVYENLRNGQFRVKPRTGLEGSDGHWGQVIDANNDSHPDVLILKWDSIQLWLGTGTFSFRDGSYLIPEASELNLVRCVAEMDFDGDGDLDLILARGHTEPGRQEVPDIVLENLDGTFVSVPFPGFSATPRDHFHVTVGDFNNDGRMDAYFSMMTQFTTVRQPDWMYLNEGDGKFSLAPPHGTESTNGDSDGDSSNAFDYNLDGLLDLLVGSRGDAWKLYENRSFRDSNHYILVRVGEPRGQILDPQFRRKALGALVKVICGGKTFLQRVGSPGQSHSQSYMDTLHFGVGECTWVESIEIHYTAEVVVKRTGVAVDQLVTVGMYYPCPQGMLGVDCNETMTPCAYTPCQFGCETVERVGFCGGGACTRVYCPV